MSSLAVLIELSLPALKRRVDAGDAIQPAWGQFLERLSDRYGLPSPPRVRHAAHATGRSPRWSSPIGARCMTLKEMDA